jgi:hypothetical protein
MFCLKCAVQQCALVEGPSTSVNAFAYGRAVAPSHTQVAHPLLMQV